MATYDAAGDVILWAPVLLVDAAATLVVAAVAGRKIRVVSCTFTAGAATNLIWLSAANPILPPSGTGMPFGGAGAGLESDRSAGNGWLMETNAGEALNLQQSAVTRLVGSINYKLVAP
jgi:hypothetical protein